MYPNHHIGFVQHATKAEKSLFSRNLQHQKPHSLTDKARLGFVPFVPRRFKPPGEWVRVTMRKSDMPQPASKVKWNGNYMFGTDSLVARPEFGCLVAAVIAGWAIIETHLGRTFATLIGAKQPTTMNMYMAARSFDVQRDLLKVAAVDVLPKRYAALFDVALIILSRAALDRHK